MMNTISGITSQSYSAAPPVRQPEAGCPESTPPKYDAYTSGAECGATPTGGQMRKLTCEDAGKLAEKYDPQNMDRTQYTKLLAELRNTGIISEQDFSIGYAGILPGHTDDAPVWPQNGDTIDFVKFLDQCVSCSADSADSQSLAETYSRLSAAFSQISDVKKSEEAPVEPSAAEDDSLAGKYTDKALELYEKLKQDETFLNAAPSRNSGVTPDSRELVKEIILTDDALVESLAKEIWIYRAENNQYMMKINHPEWLMRLPPDYTGIVDELRSAMLCGSEEEQVSVCSQFDGFLAGKAKRERLTDVERLLSEFAEKCEKVTWQSFDERMEPVRDLMEKELQDAGYSLELDKTYRFYLDTETFTFSVTGGSEETNKLLADVINTHPIQTYKFDPLHTALMALYGSRREDLSYNPWQTDYLPKLYRDELLKQYGVASDVPDEYVKKMKQFMAAYQMSEIDKGMKWQYGFGLDDISYGGGTFTGKTEEIANDIRDMGNDFMKETGYAYQSTLKDYTGTPEFKEAVFVFENGKFRITYGREE